MAYRPDWVVDAAEHMLAAFPKNRLAGLANRCGVSLSTLRRAVRSQRSLSLRQWQQRFLLSAVLNRLAHPASRSLKEISANLGFSDAGSFARWFRRQAGCTPSSFRSRAMGPVAVRGAAFGAGEIGSGASMGPCATTDEASDG